MPSKQSEALFEYYTYIKTSIKDKDFPLDIYRAFLEEVHTQASEPTDVTYEEVQCPGSARPAIWCKATSASAQHAILYFHGGGYFSGSPSMYRKMGGHLSKAAGVHVLLLDYRRAPESQFPLQLEDSTVAWQWLLEQGFKPGHIALGGDSAGGNLAVGTLLKLKQLGGTLPGAVIAFSPFLDMEMKGKSYDTNAETDGIISRASSTAGLGMWLGQASPQDPLANPLYGDFAGCPPIYISAGGHEVLLDDSVQLAEVAKASGVDVTLDVAEGMQHVFIFMAGRAPEADETLKKIGVWLRPKLNVTSH